MKQTFTIPGRLPGLNEMIDADRGNKFAASRLKRDTQDAIGWSLAKLVPMRGPVEVSVVWVEPNRRRDPDNIAAGVKYVMDSLVECGIIPNDNQRHVSGIHHRVALDRENPRVVVTIEEAS